MLPSLHELFRGELSRRSADRSYSGTWVTISLVVDAEADAVGVLDGDVKGAEQEFGAAEVDGVAGEGVDDFHERSLDGLCALDESDGVKAGFGWGGDVAHHALVEVTELLSANSGRAATYCGDLDVSANFDVGMNRHIGPLGLFDVGLIV